MSRRRKLKPKDGHENNLFGEGVGPADKLKRLPAKRSFWEYRIANFDRDMAKLDSQIADLQSQKAKLQDELERAPAALERLAEQEVKLKQEVATIKAAPTIRKAARTLDQLKALVANLKEEDIQSMTQEDRELLRALASGVRVPTI